MKEYFKLPKTEIMSDSRIELRKLDDEEWKKYIFSHIFQYYNSVDVNEIQNIFDKELKKEIAEIETAIKKHIRNWLISKSPTFDIHGFIVNREPSSEGNLKGFYDLKFQHSDWKGKYFSFEAKNLGNIKNTTQSTSINKYVYEKSENDGGMYRYFTGKYSSEQNFGGMIGFVIGSPVENIINNLIYKIISVYDFNQIGSLTSKKVKRKSIEDNEMTFDTIHFRQNYKTQDNEEFILHHIILDFTKL